MISIVIPTHKRVDLLERLLDSIAVQTWQDFEIIVVDDASPNMDDYRQLIASKTKRWPALQYVRLQANSGAPAARNEGIRRARGTWVALVDDDDEWLPRKLELQMKIAAGAPEAVGLIYGWTRVVDGAGRVLNDSRPMIEGMAVKDIFNTNFIMSPSVMVRRSVFDKVGMFDETLPSCQDWDMWARVLAGGYECRVVKELIAVYHRHGQSSIGLSARAKDGYQIFLKKHGWSIVKFTGPLNWAKKAWTFARTGPLA